MHNICAYVMLVSWKVKYSEHQVHCHLIASDINVKAIKKKREKRKRNMEILFFPPCNRFLKGAQKVYSSESWGLLSVNGRAFADSEGSRQIWEECMPRSLPSQSFYPALLHNNSMLNHDCKCCGRGEKAEAERVGELLRKLMQTREWP